jgi:hypothetical protein
MDNPLIEMATVATMVATHKIDEAQRAADQDAAVFFLLEALIATVQANTSVVMRIAELLEPRG